MNAELDIKVRAALDARRGEWQQIADAANVSHSWISKFVRGLIENPGIETLRSIDRALSDKRQRGQRRAAA